MTKLTKEEMSKIARSNVATAKSHERRVKSLLTEWSGRQFRRRRVEGRGDDTRVVEGVSDVIPVEGEIHFAIEAKKGKGFSLDALLGSPLTCLFTTWWHQNCFDAHLISDKIGKIRYPLCFFKPQPNTDWIAIAQAAINQSYVGAPLRPKPGTVRNDFDGDGLWFPHLSYDEYTYLGPIAKNVSHSHKHPRLVPLQLYSCYFCRWSDFAANVDPASFFVAPSASA
jgi:hypothetical protein